MKEISTEKEFNEIYKTDDDCLHELFLLKYGNLTNCPKCGKNFNYHKLKDRTCYSCSNCAKQLSPQADTIFHGSCIGLKKWFYIIFLMCSNSNMSITDIKNKINVSYSCASNMRKKIKSILEEI